MCAGLTAPFLDRLVCSDNDGDNYAGAGTDIFSEGFRGANWKGRDWYVFAARPLSPPALFTL
jgi:hypothetical protein